MRITWLLLFVSSLTLAAQDPPQRPAARISGGVMAGQMLTKFNPVYPPEAKAAHVEGTVVMHAIISDGGHIENLAVVSGPEMLRNAAVDAVKQWTYKPYLLNGQPTSVDTTITVNFSMGPAPGTVAMAPLPEGRIRVSSGVIAANRISGSYPDVCKIGRDQGVTGSVVLHVVIDKSGRVAEATAVSGPEVLRQPWVDAVQAWLYKPYLLNGEPVEVDTIVTVNINCGG